MSIKLPTFVLLIWYQQAFSVVQLLSSGVLFKHVRDTYSYRKLTINYQGGCLSDYQLMQSIALRD